jgi:class 3 adenylate cyclase
VLAVDGRSVTTTRTAVAADDRSDLLTAEERELIDVLADAANRFANVIGSGPTRHADSLEVIDKIHQLQQAVMAQAAARAYPASYRLLGETLR